MISAKLMDSPKSEYLGKPLIIVILMVLLNSMVSLKLVNIANQVNLQKHANSLKIINTLKQENSHFQIT